MEFLRAVAAAAVFAANFCRIRGKRAFKIGELAFKRPFLRASGRFKPSIAGLLTELVEEAAELPTRAVARAIISARDRDLR